MPFGIYLGRQAYKRLAFFISEGMRQVGTEEMGELIATEVYKVSLAR